jgi:hypothetical protein
MTELIGSPATLIAFHPTKNATEDALFPYGGGATINELDGNLTMWAEERQIKLHQNRVRGPEFEPLFFRIENICCPDIVDDKGAQILLPVMRPIAASEAEDRKRRDEDLGLALLKAMAAEPKGTQDGWAAAVGCSKSTVNANLQNLKHQRLIEKALGRGKWRITPKGIKEIKE